MATDQKEPQKQAEAPKPKSDPQAASIIAAAKEEAAAILAAAKDKATEMVGGVVFEVGEYDAPPGSSKNVYPAPTAYVNACKKCGSGVRSDGKGKIFCPVGSKSCPKV